MQAAPGTLPRRLTDRVRQEARQLGLPLDALDLLAQDAKVARGFLRAARQGRGLSYVNHLDRAALERRLHERERGISGPTAPGLRALG